MHETSMTYSRRIHPHYKVEEGTLLVILEWK
jgi:hypothetical protein